jgi:hypothetical protein
MKPFARILSRIAIIATAAALFAGLTTIYARTLHPPVFRAPGPGDRRDRRGRGDRGDRVERGDRRDPRRRPDTPQPARFPEILKESGFFALVTFAGRRILRLRL